jgi:serine/threonine protein kinase
VMELMFSNLSDAVPNYLLPASDVPQALRDVAEALRFMRSKEIVHMAVKAENVLVKIETQSGRLDGCIKLGDFGICGRSGRRCLLGVTARRHRRRACGCSCRPTCRAAGAERRKHATWGLRDADVSAAKLRALSCARQERRFLKAAEDHTLQGEMENGRARSTVRGFDN